jgi:predicted nucleic acid-binding protein
LNAFVVDASVAAKWVLPGAGEPFRDEALRLLKQWLDGKVRLIVPDFFWVELTNVLWKAVRRGRCTKDTAVAALATMLDYQIPTVPSLNLLNLALQKGVQHGQSVYDSLYVVLAVEAAAQLVTADEKLANALAAHLPVTWLGAI